MAISLPYYPLSNTGCNDANKINADLAALTSAIVALPQDLDTTDSPTFAGLALTGLTEGSVLFAGAGGVLSQDNTRLFWDNTSKKLRLGYSATRYVELSVNADAVLSIVSESENNIPTVLKLSSNDTNTGSTIELYGKYSSSFSNDGKILFYNNTTFVASISDILDSAYDAADLIFSTRPTGVDSSNTERMRIKSSGLVGIGESAPSSRLHISHTGTAGANLNILSLRNCAVGVLKNTETSIAYNQDAGGTAYELGRLTFGVQDGWAGGGGTDCAYYKIFLTTDGVSGGERFSIYSFSGANPDLHYCDINCYETRLISTKKGFSYRPVLRFRLNDTVTANTVLGEMYFEGRESGGTLCEGACIYAFALSDWAGADLRSRLYFAVKDGAGGWVQPCYIDPDKCTFTVPVSIAGTLTLGTCIDAGVDTDKFLVLDASNNVDYRTGAELVSDLIGSIDHTGLANLNTANYYHLTQANHTTLTTAIIADSLHHHAGLWESDNGAQVIYVDATGSVGIGEATPDYKTEIVGGADGVETAILSIRSNFTSANTATTLRFANSTTGNVFNGTSEICGTRETSNRSNLTFRTSNGSAIADAMNIGYLQTVGLGMAADANTHLYIFHDAISSTAGFTGLRVYEQKTAGVTDANDHYYGVRSAVVLNQAGGVIGGLYGQYIVAQIADGAVGSVGNEQHAIGSFIKLALDAGTTTYYSIGDWTQVVQNSSHTASDTLLGINSDNNIDGTCTKGARGIQSSLKITTNAVIGTVPSPQDAIAAYSFLNLDGGTINGNGTCIRAVIDQKAANTVTGDMMGIYVNVDAVGTVTGTVYGIYILDSSNVDYSLYASGNGYFGGTVEAPNLGAGEDDSVVVLDSDGKLRTDEIDSRVWGSTLVDAANGADNRVATFSDANSLNGEANLTFTGSLLTVTGDATVTATITTGALVGTTVTAGAGGVDEAHAVQIDVADKMIVEVTPTGNSQWYEFINMVEGQIIYVRDTQGVFAPVYYKDATAYGTSAYKRFTFIYDSGDAIWYEYGTDWG